MKKNELIEEEGIQKPFSSQGSEKKQESDSQMLKGVAIKFAVLYFIIFMFDVLLDVLSGVFDIISELFHLVMDVIEYSFELILEYTIHTGHQQSEIIMINGALIVALYIIYKVFFAIPRFYRKVTAKFKNSWSQNMSRRLARWKAMELPSRIKLISAYTVGTSCLLFLITL